MLQKEAFTTIQGEMDQLKEMIATGNYNYLN